MCEEYSTCQTSSVRPVLAEQSDPLFEPAKLLIMTPRPSIEILAQENVLQKCKERVGRLPQQDRLIKMRTDAGFLKTVEVRERKWTDIGPEDYSPVAFPVAKRLTTLLRHGPLFREEDGAIEFWRLKDYLRNHFEQSQHWSDEKWKSKIAGGGGNQKRFQYCTDPSGQEILYLRALQGHSGRNPIDPSLQDNVLIPDNFFEYIYHVGCAINSHSITNSGLTPGGQNLGKERQTVFFAAVDPMNKEHEDTHELDLTKPRLASYKQKWKRHQNTVYWVDTKLAQRKGLKFYQTKSNAIILYETLPAYCIPKVVVMESGEIIYEKVHMSPRPPPKISFKDNWMKELDSEVAGSSKDSQRIQPKPKTQLSRTVRPADGPTSIQSCVPVSVELVDKDEDKDEDVDADQTRTVRPVGGQSFTQLEEIDIDFRVPGLSHAVVKETVKQSVTLF